MSSCFLLCFGLCLGIAFCNMNSPSQGRCGTTKPNFVFIMTDDQDLNLNSLSYQPAVQQHFAEQGTFFPNHYCTMAQCCPSRVSMLTGKAGHNTNVTDIQPPFGGYPKFISQGLNDEYLPVWLQKAGYNTYYTGKFMNSHSITNYNSPYPKGWNGSDFLLDPYTYIYYNATMQRNKDHPKSYPGAYSTDIIASKAVGFLEDAAAAGSPFFLGVMPIGPHSETIFPAAANGLPIFDAPVPAERHKNLFQNVTVPRTPNFNPKMPSGASYVKNLPRQNQTVIDYNDWFYQRRLQALQAVDDLVNSVMIRLEELNLLDNTYIFYTADNGFHIGQHRLAPGKSCSYEEDINVPFFVRGPDVPKGAISRHPSSHTDVVPTLFHLAGLPLHHDFDGTPIAVRRSDWALPKYEHINVEFWGQNLGEGAYRVDVPHRNNTYKSLRVIGKEYNLFYSVWCTNEHELYDMKNDPYQMNNLYASPSTVIFSGYNVSAVISRLNGLLMVTKSCKGKDCVRPWEVLHPEGGVDTLQDALNPIFNVFYEQDQHQVSFEECALGYFPELEGAQVPVVYEGYEYLGGTCWSDWT